MITGRRWSSSANLSDYEIDAWNTLDLRLAKAIGSHLTLRLSLNNITDTHYEIVRNYPMPGANIITAIEYRL
jgi:outer membrane receptor protein involved in Fe transport